MAGCSNRQWPCGCEDCIEYVTIFSRSTGSGWQSSFLGASTRVCLSLPGEGQPAKIHARLPGHVDVKAGDEPVAMADAARVMLFPPG